MADEGRGGEALSLAREMLDAVAHTGGLDEVAEANGMDLARLVVAEHAATGRPEFDENQAPALTLRAKITPLLTDGGRFLHLTIDWVEVDETQMPGATVFSEEFQLSVERPGCAYVSRMAVLGEAMAGPGTFWVDERGARHFYMNADAGAFHMAGRDIASAATAGG